MGIFWGVNRGKNNYLPNQSDLVSAYKLSNTEVSALNSHDYKFYTSYKPWLDDMKMLNVRI